MSLVVNNVVKMEWQSENWLTTKQNMFVMAAQNYTNKDGETIAVVFTAHTAFLWGDEEDGLWSAKEVRDWCKKNVDGSFPTEYDEYIPVIPYGMNEALDSVLEEYGLTEYKEDIENRRADLIPFGLDRDEE